MTTNRQKFYADYSLLHDAAVGVSVIRTREPFRALDTLREWAYAQPLPFKTYSMLTGWNTFNPLNPNEPPVSDGQKDIVTAVSMIDAVTGGQPFENGVYPILWPHFMLPKVPALMQMFAELARSCSTNEKRVALIVPLSFELPPELQDSVTILDFDPPNREELFESYGRVLNALPAPKRPDFSEPQVARILNTLVGMTEAEAETALSRALVVNKDALPTVAIDAFADELMKVKIEAVKRSETLEIVPTGSMADVGGLDLLKGWIRARKTAFTSAARAEGVDPPKGCLLVGPPGTAKSLSAKAIAHELGMPLIRFDISKLFAGLVGASESKTREALKMIHAQAPCVAWIDEIDKAVTNGAGNDGGTSSRMLGTILTDMTESNDGVFWVATANRVQGLPPELIRKGRLDEIFSLLAPHEDERQEIIAIHLRKRNEDPAQVEDMSLAVDASNGYVGAEIEQAIKEAKLIAFNDRVFVTGQMIADQFAHMTPLQEAFADDFAAMTKWAADNARPASSGAGGVVTPSRVRTRSRAVETRPTQRRLSVGGLDAD